MSKQTIRQEAQAKIDADQRQKLVKLMEEFLVTANAVDSIKSELQKQMALIEKGENPHLTAYQVMKKIVRCNDQYVYTTSSGRLDE